MATTTVGTKVGTRSGADAIAETLKKCNIEIVFGYSGGGNGTLINAIAKSGMKMVCGRNEIAGAWMSYGYNRIKKRAASSCNFHCVGMLHVAPVLYAAKTDSTPLVVMDVNLDSSLDMREGLQDALEVYSVCKPLSKYIRKVVIADDLPLAVRQAVIAASTGRPGPAVLDLAYQVLARPTACKSEELTLPEPPGASSAVIGRALEMILKAKNPVIVAGAGVHLAGGGSKLQQLAETLGIPVVSTSWGGRALLADDHPLYAGPIGSFGWVSANDIAQRADLWLAVGTTFSQMSTGAWNLVRPEKVIHIDVDPGQLGKIFQPTLGIVGDAAVVLGQLLDQAKQAPRTQRPGDERDNPRLKEVQTAKKEWLDYYDSVARNSGKESGKPINELFVIQKMGETCPAGTIVVGDSGGHAFNLYRAFRYKEPSVMTMGSRYMSMGAGLPAAIGAKLAAPDRPVICFHGDGGFYYNFSELSVLAEHKLKVIVVVANNHCLIANRMGMKMWGMENPWVDLPTATDFVGVAKALGVAGERVTDADEVVPALRRAIESETSYVIDVFTDPETRIKRALKDVIPILSDRKPQQSAASHFGPPLEGAWPD
jgi:acetolactate synthase-1/2/3 large subunit